jgi:hypothetical protein
VTYIRTLYDGQQFYFAGWDQPPMEHPATIV